MMFGETKSKRSGSLFELLIHLVSHLIVRGYDASIGLCANKNMTHRVYRGYVMIPLCDCVTTFKNLFLHSISNFNASKNILKSVFWQTLLAIPKSAIDTH